VRTLSNEFRRGSYVRLQRGVYLPTGDWLAATPWGRYAIATAAMGASGLDPVFAGETALLLHDVELGPGTRDIHWQTNHASEVGRRPTSLAYGNEAVSLEMLAGLAAHRGSPGRLQLPPGVGTARHLPATGTLTSRSLPELGLELRFEALDGALAATLPRLGFASAVVVVDGVLAGRAAAGSARTRVQLEALAASATSAAASSRMLAAIGFGDARSESVGESLSRATIHLLGFAPPELQYEIREDGRVVARTDFHWPEAGVVGEFDGRIKYMRSLDLSGRSPGQVVFDEKQREDALRARGLRFVRWVWADLERPSLLAAKLLAAGVPRRPGAWTGASGNYRSA